MAESEIEKKVRRARQRRGSAVAAFQEYLQSNAEILLQLPGADAEYASDLLARLNPSGKLPRISARLKSAGINRTGFTIAVNTVLDGAQDKMIQPQQRRLIAKNLWTIFSKD